MSGSRGILAYGVHLPYNRLARSAIGEVMGSGGGRGHRSVASYDEDTTTMGVEAARRAMLRSVQYVNACNGRHGAILTCLKATMAMIGLDCGPTRMPLRPLDPGAFSALQRDLEQLGFFDWIQAS